MKIKESIKKIEQYLKKLQQNKKLMRVVWVVAVILFVLLFARYKKYKQMKIYYNKGVKFFKEADYVWAEHNFENALWQKHTKSQECKIRINLALSITTPITPESVTEDNLDEQIARLELARDYLIENDCAHKDDTAGHSKKAQKLKEEIDEYIELLKQQNSKAEEEKDKEEKDEEQKKAEEEEKRKQNEKQNQLKETFNSIEKQGLNERNENLETYKEWNFDITFTDKSW